MDDKDYKFGLSKIFFRPGKVRFFDVRVKEDDNNYVKRKVVEDGTKFFFSSVKFAEFDEIMHSDPASLKNIVSKVLTWLIRTRWRRAIWGTLSVIKCKLSFQPTRFYLLLLESHNTTLFLTNDVCHCISVSNFKLGNRNNPCYGLKKSCVVLL